METKFIEATNTAAGGINWGKFLVGRFTREEWERRSSVDQRFLLAGRGWDPQHIVVMDLQTGEGSIFRPGGLAAYDLNQKHRIWVCPMFEPFLGWLYKQDLTDLDGLPDHVAIDDPRSSISGYRREGKNAVEFGVPTGESR